MELNYHSWPLYSNLLMCVKMCCFVVSYWADVRSRCPSQSSSQYKRVHHPDASTARTAVCKNTCINNTNHQNQWQYKQLMCVRRTWLMHWDSRAGICFMEHVLTVLSMKCTDERLTSVPTYSLVLMFSRGFCCLADGTRSCANPQPSSRSTFCGGLSPEEKTDTDTDRWNGSVESVFVEQWWDSECFFGALLI